MSDALASDKQEAAAKVLAEMKKSLGEVDMKLLSGPAHEAWMKALRSLEDAVARMEKAGDIKALRAEFAPLSDALIAAVKQFGADRALYVIHCPMAFNNRGADWLQQEKEVRNPYFGSAMLTCGETTETLPAASPQPGARGHE
jgi:Cu(I)/Ag(I) efflux system membrane fusion protein